MLIEAAGHPSVLTSKIACPTEPLEVHITYDVIYGQQRHLPWVRVGVDFYTRWTSIHDFNKPHGLVYTLLHYGG